MYMDDNAIHYVGLLPVLRMTSCLAIIGQAKAMPIGRILKVTRQGAAPGTKSDACDCLTDYSDTVGKTLQGR